VTAWVGTAIDAVYVVAVIVFILGLRAMSSPSTARRGIVYAGIAMLVAVAATLATPGLSNFALIALGIIVGGGAGYYWARVVKMTAMPQMVAVFNGMGGGAAAAIGAVEMLASLSNGATAYLSAAGAVIGSISISGSVIAFLKLQGWMPQKAIVIPARQVVNFTVLGLSIVFGAIAFVTLHDIYLLPFFVFLILYGVLFTLPIGGADMPVVISMFNALTGVAVGLDGFALVNGPLGDAGYAMVIAGVLVGAAGSLLTALMARAMNRSVGNVFFGAFGATEETGGPVAGSMKPIAIADAAVMMGKASEVIMAPG